MNLFEIIEKQPDKRIIALFELRKKLEQIERDKARIEFLIKNIEWCSK